MSAMGVAGRAMPVRATAIRTLALKNTWETVWGLSLILRGSGTHSWSHDHTRKLYINLQSCILKRWKHQKRILAEDIKGRNKVDC